MVFNVAINCCKNFNTSMYSPQNDAQERSFATSTSNLMGNEPHQYKYRFTVNIYRIFSTGQHRPTLKPAYSVKGPQITYLAYRI